jgi:hypothetical protein
MTLFRAVVVVVAAIVVAPAPAIRAQATDTDVYHVTFSKAVPGQAAAAAKNLQEQDPKDPMAGHFLMLRHQEGDDWDYAVVRHVGQKATVSITPPPPSGQAPTQAWHTDSFASGPSWAEFSKLMTGPATSIYAVGVHRAVPGHRVQLLEALTRRDPAQKVPLSQVALTHIEGGPWQFLTIGRYNSWQDLAADRAAAAASEKGWFEIRQHSAWHVDTIADRVGAK